MRRETKKKKNSESDESDKRQLASVRCDVSEVSMVTLLVIHFLSSLLIGIKNSCAHGRVILIFRALYLVLGAHGRRVTGNFCVCEEEKTMILIFT